MLEALAALGPTIFPFVGSALQYAGAERQNQQAWDMSQEHMEWQERMSSTAHRREVQDLQLAGLNPILSVNAGASTPSGSSAPVVNTMEGAASSALEMANLMLTTKKQKSEIGLLNAQTKKAETDALKAATETKILGKDVQQSGFFEGMWKKLNEMSSATSKLPSFYEGVKKHGADAYMEYLRKNQKPLKQGGVNK